MASRLSYRQRVLRYWPEAVCTRNAKRRLFEVRTKTGAKLYVRSPASGLSWKFAYLKMFGAR